MADGHEYEVVVSAGSLRPAGRGVAMPHRWTEGGVIVETEFTGAHLYHLAVAGCVLNDLYREAHGLGLAILGARVRASGSFAPDVWSSEGVEYAVEVAADGTSDDVERLLERVDEVAEIPKALRAGTAVRRRVAP